MHKYYNTIIEKTTIIPKIILEIGSRDGNDANTLKNLFNIEDSNVWVVEPNDYQQVKIISKYPNFNLIKNAIFNKSGKMIFNAIKNNNIISVGVSSLLDRNDDFYEKNNAEKIEVDAITGKDLLNVINKEVDLCKIDVEGATYEVLESFGDSIYKIKSFHIENEHVEVWKNQKLYDDVKKLLISYGFVEILFRYCSNVKMQSDSIWINPIFLKKNNE